jgi:hypothetical protein
MDLAKGLLSTSAVGEIGSPELEGGGGRMNDERPLSVRIPAKLDDAVSIYENVTGRDRHDIVAGALRTYLADQADRPALSAAVEQSGIPWPRPWLVDARLTLDLPPTTTERARLEAALKLIARFAPVEVSWKDQRNLSVRMAASGFDPDEGANTVVHMLRNRAINEIGLAIRDIEVISSEPLER